MQAHQRDARQGQAGARLEYDKYNVKDGIERNTAADFPDNNPFFVHQRVTDDLKTCCEVTPWA